jgi:hypothetical protein
VQKKYGSTRGHKTDNCYLYSISQAVAPFFADYVSCQSLVYNKDNVMEVKSSIVNACTKIVVGRPAPKVRTR